MKRGKGMVIRIRHSARGLRLIIVGRRRVTKKDDICRMVGRCDTLGSRSSCCAISQGEEFSIALVVGKLPVVRVRLGGERRSCVSKFGRVGGCVDRKGFANVFSTIRVFIIDGNISAGCFTTTDSASLGTGFVDK